MKTGCGSECEGSFDKGGDEDCDEGFDKGGDKGGDKGLDCAGGGRIRPAHYG
jgi:hypothetical protein